MTAPECHDGNGQASQADETRPPCAPHESRGAKPPKRWYERTSVTLCVAAGLAVAGSGFIHIITGVRSPYGLPFDIVLRDSFGYREMLVNAERIQALPYTAAVLRYPLGIRALQKRGYLPSGRGYGARMVAEQRESMERWRAEFEEALGRPAPRWQDQLQGEGSTHRTDPEDARAYNQRGIACARQREYARAIAEFSRAIGRDPTLADAFYNRALVYLAIGNLGPAAADFGRVVEIRPDFVEGYLRRGRLLMAMNEYDAAIVQFTKAIEIDPRCAEALFHRSLAHYARGAYDRAREDVHRIRSLGLPIPSEFLDILRGTPETSPMEISDFAYH